MTWKVALPPGVVTWPATVVLAAPRLVAAVTVVWAQALAAAWVVPSLAAVSRQLVSGSGAVRPSWPGVTTWVISCTELPGLQPVGMGPFQANWRPSSHRPAGMPMTSSAGLPAPWAKVIRRLEEPSSALDGVKVCHVGSPLRRYRRVSAILVGFHGSSWMDCGASQL